MENNEREELIRELLSIKDKVECHFIDSESTEFCDERATPLLEISIDDTNEDYVEWKFYFPMIEKTFRYSEPREELINES